MRPRRCRAQVTPPKSKGFWREPGALLVVVALLGSLVFTPAALAQVETVGSFLVKLAHAAGFDVPVPADALRTLVERGIISRPLGNVLSRYLESELTKGLMARTLLDVMRLDAQLVRASTQEMVNFLAQRGILTAGPAGSLVTAEEVAAILANPTVAAAISAALVPVVVAPVVLAPVAPLVIAGGCSRRSVRTREPVARVHPRACGNGKLSSSRCPAGMGFWPCSYQRGFSSFSVASSSARRSAGRSRLST